MPRTRASRPAPPGYATRAPDYGPAELTAALHTTVARIGAGGPQATGLVRIRRAVRVRRQRRAVMAGGASVLLAVMATGALIGNGFGVLSLVGVAKPHGARSSPGDGGQPQRGGEPSQRPTPSRSAYPQPRLSSHAYR